MKTEIEHNPETPYRKWERTNWDNLFALFEDYCSEMHVKHHGASGPEFYEFRHHLYKETSHGK